MRILLFSNTMKILTASEFVIITEISSFFVKSIKLELSIYFLNSSKSQKKRIFILNSPIISPPPFHHTYLPLQTPNRYVIIQVPFRWPSFRVAYLWRSSCPGHSCSSSHAPWLDTSLRKTLADLPSSSPGLRGSATETGIARQWTLFSCNNVKPFLIVKTTNSQK